MMSERTDRHTHTLFSDGKTSPEEMVRAAVKRGMTCIGISDHAHTPFDERYCMKTADVADYQQELRRLAERYRGQIRVECGIEQDYWSDTPTDGYDYVIGSVHYLRVGDGYYPVDEDAETLRRIAETVFGGDVYEMCELYFGTVSDVVRKTGAGIVGHFDLISKFLEKDPLFDVQNPRYVRAWQAAANQLLRDGAAFEINTGGIYRGYRTDAYPSREIRAYLRANGARMVLSSDSHCPDALCYRFADYEGDVSPDGDGN